MSDVNKESEVNKKSEANKKILVFSAAGDFSSFSRITESILPTISSKYEVTLISNNKCSFQGPYSFVKVGADTDTITYSDYLYGLSGPMNQLEINMKYVVIQIADLLYSKKFDSFLLINSIYECNWFMSLLEPFIKKLRSVPESNLKIVIWSPIDYIPLDKKIIEHCLKADVFLTMTPIMVQHTKKIAETIRLVDVSFKEPIIDYLGHGSNLIGGGLAGFTNSKKTKIGIIKEFNKLRNNIWIGSKLEITDIIILNANNCKNAKGRKRLDISCDAFKKLLKYWPHSSQKIKLWIHSDIKTVCESDILDGIPRERLILSNNTVSDKHMSMIYSLSDIGLQTSSNEAWSLTNMEGSLYNSIQVVPDFLATGYHFADGRGVLIPATKVRSKNESGLDVLTGQITVEDTYESLKKALEIVLNNGTGLSEIHEKARKYAEGYTWSDISNKLANFL
jgi:glycosyltransferase involved in cell wall biosynthesis